MVVFDCQGTPAEIHFTSAPPAEVTLVEPTLNGIRMPRVGGGEPRRDPDRTIGDRGD
jgi:hypothetical protein